MGVLRVGGVTILRKGVGVNLPEKVRLHEEGTRLRCSLLFASRALSFLL